MAGFPNFDVSSYLISAFNTINKKYGDEKLVAEDEDVIDVNDLEDFQEILTFQGEEMMEDFENLGDLE